MSLTAFTAPASLCPLRCLTKCSSQEPDSTQAPHRLGNAERNPTKQGSLLCQSSSQWQGSSSHAQVTTTRRGLVETAVASAALSAFLFPLVKGDEAFAISSARKAMREQQIKEEDFKTLDSGLKYYDMKVGGGRLAELGDRVTVHYVVKWKGITFLTSRQGDGVTGGTPYGFDVGASDRGTVLKGLDFAVRGMRVGGQRELIVPPELGYGQKGIREIPPNATLQMNVELLSIKESPFGFQDKVVEE